MRPSGTPAPSPQALDAAYLRTLPAIRERCGQMLRLAEAERLPHFRLDLTRLDDAVREVVATTRERYPTLHVPLHSRWRHFDVGGTDRLARLEADWGACDAMERARRKVDLAVVSVLLDAGAGPQWHYRSSADGHTWSRSEGLAVASLELFAAGWFSSDPAQPWRVDGTALQALTTERLATGLQVAPSNPLTGIEGRAGLLRRLGAALSAQSERYGAGARPGGLVDHVAELGQDGHVPMSVLWDALMSGFDGIWPGDRPRLAGVPLGDVWQHSVLADQTHDGGYVPFHKLTQWLAYSLLEPLAEAGIVVSGSDELTGLAEYRNGGLLVDSGVLALRDPTCFDVPLPQNSEPVVEWRALTVALLDRLAVRVRDALGLDAKALPLGAVLQGGTWEAGRRLARKRRPDGAPPFRIETDGMLF